MKIKRQTLSQSGASAIEFAIILPVLLLILFGIIEFSVLFYNKAMITNASREGARVGIRYDDVMGHTPQGDIEDVVDAYLEDMLITFSSAPGNHTTQVTADGITSGSNLEVRVSYDYDFLVLPKFADNVVNLTLNARTTMRLE